MLIKILFERDIIRPINGVVKTDQLDDSSVWHELDEFVTFKEKLRRAANQKINLDPDDAIKVKYAKFGDLLVESKTITGGKDEE